MYNSVKTLGIIFTLTALSACGGGAGGTGGTQSSVSSSTTSEAISSSVASSLEQSSSVVSSLEQSSASLTSSAANSVESSAAESSLSSEQSSSGIVTSETSSTEQSSSSIVSSSVASSESSSSLEASSTSSSSESSSVAAGQTLVYEAELAFINLGSVETNHANYSGTGFVDLDNVSSSYLEWTVNQVAAGNQTLTIRFANGSASNRSASISVNGQVVYAAQAFMGTGTWDTWSSTQLEISLIAGANTIRIASANNNGGPNLDYIQLPGGILVEASSSSSSQVSSALVSSSSLSSVASSASSRAISSSIQSSTSSAVNSSAASSATSELSAACIDLVNNPATNWRESSLQSDQEIVQCLHDSLGKAVGYGEQANGGYDPNGNSHLIVISKSGSVSVEQQVLNAISTEAYNWIVFDKDDFAEGGDIAMYRLYCSSSLVLTDLGNATQAECLDHHLWCQNHGVGEASCAASFFNDHLDDANLPIRNETIMSNTTLDGRGAKPRFLFNGFKIGADDSGVATYTAQNVVVTHLLFEGAGHAEDHHLDPDMIRSTGASHDIWIHKNTFKNTGDSAFDVKVGAYNITMSFNRLIDVLRASLHGSSDSRTINAQIRTSMHNNFFITTDEFFDGPHQANNTARRVPLLRRGSAHMFNNVFYDYRKNFASVRVGGTLFMESNVFLGGTVIQTEKSSLAASFSEWLTYLTKDDFTGGYFSSTDGLVTFADDNCRIDNTFQGYLPAMLGEAARDLKDEYGQASRDAISNLGFSAGQDLVDYTNATAGRDGLEPYNSPLAQSRSAIITAGQAPCLSL